MNKKVILKLLAIFCIASSFRINNIFSMNYDSETAERKLFLQEQFNPIIEEIEKLEMMVKFKNYEITSKNAPDIYNTYLIEKEMTDIPKEKFEQWLDNKEENLKKLKEENPDWQIILEESKLNNTDNASNNMNFINKIELVNPDENWTDLSNWDDVFIEIDHNAEQNKKLNELQQLNEYLKFDYNFDPKNYRHLAFQYHPDKYNNDNTLLNAINEFQDYYINLAKIYNIPCSEIKHLNERLNFDIGLQEVKKSLLQETQKQIAFLLESNFDSVAWKYIPSYIELYWIFCTEQTEQEKKELLNIIKNENLNKEQKTALFELINKLGPIGNSDEEVKKFKFLYENKIYFTLRAQEYIQNKIAFDKEQIEIINENLEERKTYNSENFSTMINPFNSNSSYRKGISSFFWNEIISFEALNELANVTIGTSKFGEKSTLESNKAVTWALKIFSDQSASIDNMGKIKKLYQEVNKTHFNNTEKYLLKKINSMSCNPNQKRRVYKRIKHLEK